MRADGTLEVFDEILLPGYKELASQIDPYTGYPYRQRRDRGARIDDLFIMIHAAIKSYEAYYVRTGPFRGYFQFARYLEKGNKIYNRTTGEVYTVADLFMEDDGLFIGEVLLTGVTEPTETDRLELDEPNQVLFARADARSEATTSTFDSNTERVEVPAPFTDTIEYSTVRSEPGTVGKKPFAADRQALPRLREFNVNDLIDPGVGIDIYGWWFDHMVQFDLFARTNERLYGTRNVSGEGTLGLVQWFQDFMQRYRWVFLYNGIQQLLEWQGTRDQQVGRHRNDMVHRPLLFYVRTERVSEARYRRIEHIDILVNIGAPGEAIPEPTGYPQPTGQLNAHLNDLGLYNSLEG
jgi:hypothetical protein